MTGKDVQKAILSRRRFLRSSVAMTAASAVSAPALAAAEPVVAIPDREPFWGTHQAGILTPAQAHTYFAAFDLTTTGRSDIIALMRRWTGAAAMLSVGRPVDIAGSTGYDTAQADPADVLELSPARLTITFGFGAGLFVKAGKDRYGLAKLRPAAFVDLPNFPGEQLVPASTGGDLSIQACADNPQVAFHAVRQLARLAYGVADIRWVQSGFVSDYGPKTTPRNLMGFKDGTGNPSISDAAEMDRLVWAGDEAPAWMRGGSYMVIRRARIALEHWDRMKVMFQEQTFGRKKLTGAPLGKDGEFDSIDLDLQDSDGNPVVPENAHVRIAHQAGLDGAKVLRRSYSYNDGVNLTAERWPPWHQGMEFDAGLMFLCYQRDVRRGFIPIFGKMSRFDLMNQFVTNVGGGHFACPAGVMEGGYIGRALFEA